MQLLVTVELREHAAYYGYNTVSSAEFSIEGDTVVLFGADIGQMAQTAASKLVGAQYRAELSEQAADASTAADDGAA